MPESQLYAYVDESGSNALDTSKSGESNLYICVAVVVDDAGREACEAGMEALSQRLNGGAEIASKSIGTKHQRRMQFLESIESLPFHYYALVINKDRLPKDSGFQFKRSFYKFFNRMLYRRLATGSCSLHVIADEYGGQDFMDSFQVYLESKGLPDLFSDFLHDFVDSTQSRMVQLADLIAGSLSYCFDQEKKGDHSAGFRRILRNKEAGIQCWPLDYMPSQEPSLSGSPSLDSLLRDALCQRAQDFINDYEESIEDDQQMQAATLKRLLFARLYEDGSARSVYSATLIEALRDQGFEELSDQTFKLRVIGKIRDRGILLAGSNEGFRLALDEEDIADYLLHDKSIIEPMLNRLLLARNVVKDITHNQHDILAAGGFEGLLRIADEFHDSRIEAQAQRTTDDQSDFQETNMHMPAAPRRLGAHIQP